MKKLKDYITLIKNHYHRIIITLWGLGILFNSACSLIVSVDNSDLPAIQSQMNKNDQEPTSNGFAHVGKSDVILSSSPELTRHYNLVMNLLKSYKFETVDKFVLLALLQMNLRPELASPSANLRIITNTNAGTMFHSYLYKSTTSWPYLNGLNEQIIKHKGQHNMAQLATWLDLYAREPKLVGQELALFLKTNKEALSKHPVLKKYFFKAEQPLGPGESLPPLPYLKLIKSFYNQKRDFKRNDQLIPYQGDFNPDNKQTNILCNEDFSRYDQSQYFIKKKDNPTLSLGIMDQSGNFFMLVSSQDLSTLSPLNDTFLLEAPSYEDSVAFCYIHNKMTQNHFSVVSSGSRDPGQLIHHLIQYEMPQVKSLSELTEYINFPRHLFLLNPLRMVYESERGSNSQLNRFLSMNFPIYHAPSIGNLWIHARFDGDREENGLVWDLRNNYFSSAK